MMENLFLSIEKLLKGKCAIVGIGSEIKGDDGVGSILISRLKGKTSAKLFDCAEVPENYIQPIIKVRPDSILIVDACDWAGSPGELKLVKNEELEQFGFSTHNASLALFCGYLKQELPNLSIIILGIQIKGTGLMQPLSCEVKATLERLVEFFMRSQE